MGSRLGDITLADILTTAGMNDLNEIVLLRHTYGDGGLERNHIDHGTVLAYTREQGYESGHKLGLNPPATWLIFLADGKSRARLFAAYQNHGEVAAERTNSHRYFDLRLDSELLGALWSRLVVDWGTDAINWAKKGARSASMRVLEIADPGTEEFPGYENVCIDYGKLQDVVSEPRYIRWQAALKSVKAIYLIADSTGAGLLYVGKADGDTGVLGRWTEYARSGHGGNVSLRERTDLDPSHADNFIFSILRVFSPSASQTEIDAAETHFKKALLTRKFGHNRN